MKLIKRKYFTITNEAKLFQDYFCSSYFNLVQRNSSLFWRPLLFTYHRESGIARCFHVRLGFTLTSPIKGSEFSARFLRKTQTLMWLVVHSIPLIKRPDSKWYCLRSDRIWWQKRFSHHKLDLIGGGTDNKWVLAGPNRRVLSSIECSLKGYWDSFFTGQLQLQLILSPDTPWTADFWSGRITPEWQIPLPHESPICFSCWVNTDEDFIGRKWRQIKSVWLGYIKVAGAKRWIAELLWKGEGIQ